jgi:hypothetical protein
MSLVTQSQLLKPYVDISELSEAKRLNNSIAKYSLLFPCLLLILFQLLDGILTVLGVNLFGSNMEGNPILRNLIELVGPVFALAIAKTFGIIMIISIFHLSTKYALNWVTGIMWGLNITYLSLAIIPWTFLIVSQ